MSNLETYKDISELPIYNYYEGFRNPALILRQPREITEIERAILLNRLYEFQDTFSEKVNKTKHLQAYRTLSKIISLQLEIVAISALIEMLSPFDDECNLEHFLSKEQLAELRANMVKLKVPFYSNAGLTAKSLASKLGASKNMLNKLQATAQTNHSDYNYMEAVLSASKVLGYRVDPKTTTLYEWVHILEVLKKVK